MPLTKIEGPSLGNVTITNITSNVSFDSDTLYIDATNNRVGIGNTAPTHTLRVQGTTSVSGNMTVDADLVITGNLTVSGSTVTVNSENVLIKDNILTLSSNVTGTPVLDAGIEVNRGTSANVAVKWNETSDIWQLTNDGTNYGNILTTLSSTGINASALSTGTVPLGRLSSANSSANGVVDTTTQTFAGDKTFTGISAFSANVNVDSGTLFVDAVNDRVGIGNTAPTHKLRVEGTTSITGNVQIGTITNGTPTATPVQLNLGSTFADTAGSTTKVKFKVFEDTSNNIYGLGVSSSLLEIHSGSATAFYSAGTERMRIDSGGNVAIGQTATNDRFTIARSSGASASAELVINEGTYFTRFNSRNGQGSYSPLSSLGDHAIIFSDGTISTGSFVIGQWSGFPRGIRIASNGNVGICEADPSYRLDVTITSGPFNTRFRNTSTSTTDYNAILITQGATGSATGYLGTGGADTGNISFRNTFVVGTQSAHALVFNTNDSERARIDSSGTVSITNQAYIGGQTINGQSYYQWESATYRNPGDWTPRLMIRRDNATTGLLGAYPALVLYNDNGADQSTVALAFASAEAVSGTAGRNSVNLAGLIAKKEGAGVAGSWSSGSLTLFTKNGGTQVAGLTVTSSGAVTLGSQPAFGAYKQNTSSGVTGTVTGYEVTKINRGSHFNATNGRFTAPVAGAYYFTFSAFQDTNTSGVMNLQIQVNGADVGIRQYTDDASGLYGPSTTISIVLSLSASDYVTAVVATGTVHGNQNAYFSGYLLG